MRRHMGVAPGLASVLLALVLLGTFTGDAQGQAGWRDLVITGGVSGEGYQGNLPTAGVVVRDSTETAQALVGELALRGDGYWRLGATTRGTLFLDGGVRQFTARGFQQRDYAPREWVGKAELGIHQGLGERTTLSGFLGARGRGVEDRAPMPLFLQPAHEVLEVGAELRTAGGHWNRVVLGVSGERADYRAPVHAPQVRLLDREMLTTRLAGEFDLGDGHALEGFLALDLAHYQEQSTFNPEDPFRRDRTFRGRTGWSYRGGFLARAGVEGRLNRSNSRRPEYASLTLDAELTAPLPASTIASAYLVLTAKEYREPTPFARLLPGEEANSASLLYLTFTRPLTAQMDGGIRLGWSRAETETGGQYFQRMGATFLFTWRPFN